MSQCGLKCVEECWSDCRAMKPIRFIPMSSIVLLKCPVPPCFLSVLSLQRPIRTRFDFPSIMLQWSRYGDIEPCCLQLINMLNWQGFSCNRCHGLWDKAALRHTNFTIWSEMSESRCQACFLSSLHLICHLKKNFFPWSVWMSSSRLSILFQRPVVITELPSSHGGTYSVLLLCFSSHHWNNWLNTS